MRIIKATGENFQSYQHIEFSYDSLGLALISGAQGSGKSTSMDLPVWILTGTTSKESAADDVRSWFSEELTTGKLEVETPSGLVIITRIRGLRSSQNDLYFTMNGGTEPVRGKDAKDTERQLHELLGIDTELYISGSYLHQFSKADQFFTSKAKDRRETLERLANLDLPIKLGERASEARKAAKKAKDIANDDHMKISGRVDNTKSTIQGLTTQLQGWDADLIDRVLDTQDLIEQWDESQADDLASIESSIDTFEITRTVRVNAAKKTVEDWETNKKQRLAKAMQQIELWEQANKAKIELTQANLDQWGAAQGEKGMKIAGQLGIIEKDIQDPQTFVNQIASVKAEMKAIAAVEEAVKEKRGPHAYVKLKISMIQDEYAKLDSLEGVCPTCLGPADNDHAQARKAEIETEIVELVAQEETLGAELAALELALENKESIADRLDACRKREAANKLLIDRAETLRASVVALRAESNPYTKQLETMKGVSNPHLGAIEPIQFEKNPHASKVEHVLSEPNPYHKELEHAKKAVNPHNAKLESLKAETNPHLVSIHLQEVKLKALEEDLNAASNLLTALDRKVSALTWLYDKSFELRGVLLEQAVKQLQDKTNEMLERFFEAELRVTFELKDSDKLEVGITNSGYPCPYKQLSGGERCLLKLTFGLNYMKAAENRAGVNFNVLMMDESFNGLDAQFKVKAFSLLQKLESEYETVLVIDHSEELKQLFTTKFIVEKSGAYSTITPDDDH